MSDRKGYILAELDVTDPQVFFDEYMPAVRPVLEAWGARFLVATDSPQVIEGDRTVRRVVFIEFDSPRRASEFYHSDAYQRVARIRFRSARTHLYMMDGVATPA